MEDGAYLKEMGSKIKSVRNANKISLRQLGEMCNLDFTSISRIECGQHSSRILTLKAIADKLNVDVKDFL